MLEVMASSWPMGETLGAVDDHIGTFGCFRIVSECEDKVGLNVVGRVRVPSFRNRLLGNSATVSSNL